MDMSDIDLMVHFQEEPLLLIPSMAEAKPKVLKKKNWRRSVDCMWYDVPRADEVGCASLEGLLPGHLEDFCIEVLGVPALQADEVAARLDILRRTQSQIDERSNGPACHQQVVKAYLEILTALERRLDAGCQFRNLPLVQQLRERVFIPETGFVNATKCRWRSCPGRSAACYDLSEVYSAEHFAESSQLQRYFTFWLDVPTTLSLEEILEALRALRSSNRLSRWTGHALEEGPTLPRAAALYKELCLALRSHEPMELQAFKDEALIYGASAGRWLKACECLWKMPDRAPEGWSTQREELLTNYGPDPLLKEVFTERLGVPVSVRFDCSWEAPVVPVALQGQPVWILDEAAGDLPQSSLRSEASRTSGDPKAGAEPAPQEPVESDEIVEAKSDSGDAELASEAQPKAAGTEAAVDETCGPVELAKVKGSKVSQEPTAEADSLSDPEGYVESNVQLRGVASDGRQERRQMLEKLAASVKTMSNDRQMVSKSNRVKHRSEVCVDCNPQHDLVKVGHLELPMADVSIPVWVERGQTAAMARLKACRSSQALDRFADLLMAVADLFSVPCRERVHIFEEDSQTVAFNSAALFFNLRFFVEESHDKSWEEAVSFWTVSFAHELAHFESPLHDRQHGRAMEMSQRAILPRFPQVLARPWGAAPGTQNAVHRTWHFRTDSGLM